MAKDSDAVPSVPRSHGTTGPKTAGMRPFDAAGQYGRQEKPEDAARLPGLDPEQYKAHVTDYHEKLADRVAKNRKAGARSIEADASASADVTDTTAVTPKGRTR